MTSSALSAISASAVTSIVSLSAVTDTNPEMTPGEGDGNEGSGNEGVGLLAGESEIILGAGSGFDSRVGVSEGWRSCPTD